MPPISSSQIMLGIEFADIARRRKAAGNGRRAPTPTARRSDGEQTHEGRAGIEFLPPACQFLPAISHPRIFAAECLA